MARVKSSLRILMTGMVDYAGLFPPASLDMATTLANWARYASSKDSWMLGRLIVPMARLAEFERALESTSPPPPGEDPWRVSALVGDNLDADIDRIFAFNRKWAPEPPATEASVEAEGDVGAADLTGGVAIDAIEIKATSGGQIDNAMKTVPEQLEPYFEVPVLPAGQLPDLRSLITAMAGTGARAKIRTGGVTPDAFPAPADVARFITACAAADVPFKATAGLHHPVRAEYPLTYEPGCPRGVMYGFLNVFLAAAFVRAARFNEADCAAVLQETNPKAFTFDEHGVSWRDKRIDAARLARVRESFAASFGSCSFEEPLADLRSMGLIPAGE